MMAHGPTAGWGDRGDRPDRPRTRQYQVHHGLTTVRRGARIGQARWPTRPDRWPGLAAPRAIQIAQPLIDVGVGQQLRRLAVRFGPALEGRGEGPGAAAHLAVAEPLSASSMGNRPADNAEVIACDTECQPDDLGRLVTAAAPMPVTYPRRRSPRNG